ncbi:hypothetical protein N431DRAFT_490488 [Stipitochalara longipes BDJ]|nr:hypothetical protein N431DRAFT_490488 [Stipitochalara longipes BDJ]
MSYSLGEGVYDNNVSGIRVRWQAAGRNKLEGNAADLEVSVGSLKAYTEDKAWRLAYRLGSTSVLIRAAIHDTSTNSATAEVFQDRDHITVELTGSGPKKRAHIYVGGRDPGTPAQLNNMDVVGESVFVYKSGRFDLDTTLSTGEYALAGTSEATSSTTPATSRYSTNTYDERRGKWMRYDYEDERWEAHNDETSTWERV